MSDKDLKSGLKREIVIHLSDLCNSDGRIVRDSKGGIAYSLFDVSARSFPGCLRIASICDRRFVRKYLHVLDDYLEYAQKHAQARGFDLVRVLNGVISDDINCSSYNLGIGSRFANFNQIGDFFEMLRQGRDGLDKRYDRLVKLVDL